MSKAVAGAPSHYLADIPVCVYNDLDRYKKVKNSGAPDIGVRTRITEMLGKILVALVKKRAFTSVSKVIAFERSEVISRCYSI